jgi:hypothetical protein
MNEYRILVRLNNTFLRKKREDRKVYGYCQVCSDKYAQYCIEASMCVDNRKHVVFVFCNDCHCALNDICSLFVYKKIEYTYEDSYHISEIQIKKKRKWCCSRYFMEPIWRNA